jgi:hypothetical protein
MAPILFAIACVVVTIIASLIAAHVPVPKPRGKAAAAKREAAAEGEAADVADDDDADELSADEVEAAEKRD